jgi:hypothetical protein
MNSKTKRFTRSLLTEHKSAILLIPGDASLAPQKELVHLVGHIVAFTYGNAYQRS